MAKTEETQQEFNSRHRIVGAIVLVALAVILVPIVLDRNELPDNRQALSQTPSSKKIVVTTVEDIKRRQTGQTNEPSKTSQTGLSSKTGKDVTVKELLASIRSTGPTNPKSGYTIKREKVETVNISELKPKALSTPEKKIASKPINKETSTAVSAKGWVVQLGTYGKTKNAQRLRDRLKSKGYSVYLEEVHLKQGRMTRVRSGPFGKEAKAEQIQAQIREEIDISGVVIKLP